MNSPHVSIVIDAVESKRRWCPPMKISKVGTNFERDLTHVFESNCAVDVLVKSLDCGAGCGSLV